MKKVIGITVTLAAGLVVGAALGILFAPEEGLETRKKLMRNGKKLVGFVDENLEEGKETLEEMQVLLQKQLKKVNEKLNRIS